MRGSSPLEQIRRTEILYPLCRKGLDLPPPVGILFLKLYKNQMLSAFSGDREPAVGFRRHRRPRRFCRAPEDQ